MIRLSTCKPLDQVWSGVGAGTIGLGIVAIIGTIVAGVTTALVLFTASFAFPPNIYIAGGALIAACIAGIAALVLARNYFYDYKLACIEDNVCVMGKAILMEYNADGDKSMDLLLAPANEKTTPEEYQFKMWQSVKLIFKDIGLTTRNWHLDVKGNRAKKPIGFGPNELPFFHCEIQGTKIDDWITALIAYFGVLIGLATAAIIAVSLGLALGPIGWALLAAIALLALLLSIFGISVSGGDNDEASIDLDNLQDATPNGDDIIVTDSKGNNIQNGDFVLLNGPHITDTGHNPTCWNEIHPVMAIAKISIDDYNEVGFDKPSATFEKFCSAIKDSLKRGENIALKNRVLEHTKLG
jgi:hypothetical protein